MTQDNTDNRKATLELGTKPVGRLLAQYALPAIIAMTASSLYNIIDRAFIGQVVGPMAISGLAITFPFMNLSGAFGAAVGIGASTAISVKLGQRDYQTAERLLGNTVTLNLIIGFTFGVVCLLFLDPILRFFGASEQTLALVYQMKLFADRRELLHLKRGIYRLKAGLVKNIVGIGISPFLMNVCACIIVIFMNNQFVRFGGDLVVGSYGIANAISTVFLMFVLGLNQGMQPIAGYNYGSQQTDRLMRVLRLSIVGATCIMTAGWLVAMLLPYYCARLFTADATLVALSIKAIRINMFFFPVIGFQMVVTNFFQCIGKVKVSIFLSLSRQLLFLLPLLAVLPRFFGVDGVWYSLPVSDLTAALVAAAIMSLYMRKFKKQVISSNHG